VVECGGGGCGGDLVWVVGVGGGVGFEVISDILVSMFSYHAAVE
jgi:hypothetical protein